MRYILFILMVLNAKAIAQDLNAEDWLNNMSKALHEKSFKASLVHVQATQINPLIFISSLVDDKEVDFVEFIDGPQKNIVRVGNIVTYIETQMQPYSIRANRTQALLPFSSLKNISSQLIGYSMVLQGRSRVASRQAQIIRFLPKDNFRYPITLWLDVKTSLPLRYEIQDFNDHIIERMSVVELLLLSDVPVILQDIKDVKSKTWPEPVSYTRNKINPYKFAWLPIGFKVLVQDKHKPFGMDNVLDYIAITDGINQISVYVAPITELPAEIVTDSGVSFVSKQVNNKQIVAIGKVPTTTLIKIISNIEK